MKRTILAALVLFAGAAYAQPTPTRIPPKYTVSTAPSCVDGEPKLYSVTDAASSSSCTVGGGTTEVICQCLDGTASVVGSGGGGGSISDGDKGDITVSGSGATWTLDADAGALSSYVPVTKAGQQTITATGAGNDVTIAASDDIFANATDDVRLWATDQAGGKLLLDDAQGLLAGPGGTIQAYADADSFDVNTASGTTFSVAGVLATVQGGIRAFPRSTPPVTCDGTVHGTIYFDSDDNLLYVCNASAWRIVRDGGAAATATALAANGANCSAGQYPLGVDASGAVESCTADGPSTYAASVSAGGPATTATALAANGANCSAGNYPLGVDASGAVEGCTAASGGGIGGSTGSTDNALLRADGTGGSTVQGSVPTLTDGGQFLSPDGSTAAPTYGYTSDPDTGTMLVGTARLGMIVAGSYGYEFNSIGLHPSLGTVGVPVLRISGSTYPQIYFYNDDDTGLVNTIASTGAQGVLELWSDGAPKLWSRPAGINLLNVVEANTAGSGAPNAIAATESGTCFTNEGATALNVHNFPTAVAGYQFCFIVVDTDGIRVNAAAGDILHIPGDASTAGGYCESTTLDSSVTWIATNATDFRARQLAGTWSCDGP